jgi:chromosome partitioning protein
MQYAAFISYSRRDKAKARRLHAALEKAGLRTWMDADNLQTGDPLTTNIKTAIEQVSCVILLLSEYSNVSEWVQREIDFARSANKRIFILSVRNLEPSSGFHDDVRDLVRIDAGVRIRKAAVEQIVADVWSANRNRTPVVSVLNMKGGVGKTTLSFHLFGCMHDRRNVSILLIDLDPQHNLSQLMVPMSSMDSAWREGRSVMSMFEPSQLSGWAAPAANMLSFNFEGELAKPDQVSFPIKPRHPRKPRFDIVLGHFEVVKYSLADAAAHKDRLVKNFASFLEWAKEHYGLVVIDLNPGASFLTEVALNVSTHLLAPVRPDRYSKRGLDLIDRLMDKAYRIAHLPQRLAIVNGYHRSGNPTVREDEDKVIAEIDAERWRRLKAKVGLSDLLQARKRPPRPDEDLTYWLAHKQWHTGNAAIRGELEAAADELGRELGVA